MSVQLREKLWEAMLTVFPAVVVQDLKMAPSGCAQLVREHAEALVSEWTRSVVEPPPRRTRRRGVGGAS